VASHLYRQFYAPRLLQIISDGSGGAIITWQDDRNGPNDLVTFMLNRSIVPVSLFGTADEWLSALYILARIPTDSLGWSWWSYYYLAGP